MSKAPPPPLYCDTTSCDLDPLFCSQTNKEEWGNPFSFEKRDFDVSLLEKRGPQRELSWKTVAGYIVTQYSLTYPTSGAYMRRLQAGLQGISRRWWRMRSRDCDDPAVSPARLDENEAAPTGAQVEHTVPVSLFCSLTITTAPISRFRIRVRYFLSPLIGSILLSSPHGIHSWQRT